MPNEAEHYTLENDDKIFIKAEIKQEYGPDLESCPGRDANFVKIEPHLAEFDSLKSETFCLDHDDKKYFISSNDLKQISTVDDNATTIEPANEITVDKSDAAGCPSKRCTPKICPYCNVRFPSSKNFKSHVKSHTDERPFHCGLCDSKFKEKYHLVIHIKTHRGERNIRCPVCDKSFIVQSALRAHMRTHSKEKPYVCHICGKGFSHVSSLKPHISTHSEGLLFECEQCGERVRDRRGLLSHMRLHHVDCQVEGCAFCLKFNKNSGKTLRELQKRMWKCPYCVESFKYYPTYKNHVKTHNKDSFPCDYCDRTYLNLAQLRVHMRNHTGESAFECNDCGKKFKRKDSLKYHVSTHSKERRLFHCDVCNQGYTHSSSLFKHKRDVHTISNEKSRMSCRMCEEKLDQRAYRVHMKKHGLRVFKCKKCKGYVEGEEAFDAHKKTKCLSVVNVKEEAPQTTAPEEVACENVRTQEFEMKAVKIEEA